jgi:hypothetical protein
VRQHRLEASEDISVLSLLAELKLVKASSNLEEEGFEGICTALG